MVVAKSGQNASSNFFPPKFCQNNWTIFFFQGESSQEVDFFKLFVEMVVDVAVVGVAVVAVAVVALTPFQRWRPFCAMTTMTF